MYHPRRLIARYDAQSPGSLGYSLCQVQACDTHRIRSEGLSVFPSHHDLRLALVHGISNSTQLRAAIASGRVRSMVWPWHHGGRDRISLSLQWRRSRQRLPLSILPPCGRGGMEVRGGDGGRSLGSHQVLAGQPEHVTRWSVVALGCLGNALMFLRIGQHLKALNRRDR